MGQDVTHEQLMKALALYQERYGQLSTIKIDPRQWDDVLTEVKYGDSSRETSKQTAQDTRRDNVPTTGTVPDGRG